MLLILHLTFVLCNVVSVKSKAEILQYFVAFSEYLKYLFMDNTYYEQMQVQVLLQWKTSYLKLSVPKATEQFLPDRLLFISFFTVLSTDIQMVLSFSSVVFDNLMMCPLEQ